MDRFELKEKLIEVLNEVEALASQLLAPGCVDVETGEKRAAAVSTLMKSYETIHELMSQIY